ncbi:Murein DD-endopeptidase MepM and murein hydrolase activator NlpD, contain LysM domain [Noviherbaspirillum humi]|uniref:Murein DD-endopeptidase MepM and murein hydrolase activator NlpD, contain LysM domain n=1 Tax=Noviherbaspirillum humi TaxID=1688639 RepID=A0A239L8B4_9BURK|nr:peptidoglycan DD-metalloendopeptidase family protein [Noviherbaspirillum humi]SNT26565.1 Murein DD-endopeptidase MepM and murein hydrolase activator NlpD, contain LysM domain [Noviherbaspirillum humi]
MRSIDNFPGLSLGRKLLGTSRKTRIVSASALFLAACAFGAAGVAPMAPDAADLPVKSITEELAIPTLADQIASLEAGDIRYYREERVRPGDTLATLLKRLGVDDEAAASFIKADALARNVLQLKAGRQVQAQTSASGALQRLSATLVDTAGNPVKTIVVSRDGDKFKSSETSAKLERRIEMQSGEIRSSLFAATDAAQIPDSVASQIVDMFSTNIDFAADLRRGDRFNVVYETFWQDGEFVRAGRVLAGEFVNNGSTYQAVWFDEPGNRQGGGYYAFDGRSLKKAFLKSPLEFSRISSGFSMRSHPISGQWKQHQGVDFAAAVGTPIRAAGDGVIDFIGTQNGYGNVVVIKHWNDYSTAYAHMSRFAGGLHKGSKIGQGEVIGYVGMTGWSTGPHLHYEFRVNNTPRDPLSIEVPNAQALAGAELQRFRSVASDMQHRFALLSPGERGNIKVASR